MTDAEDAAARRQAQQARDPLERAVSWTSGAVILVIVGFLLAEGLRPAAPPAFSIAFGEIRAVDATYYVPVRVRNTGDRSAESVALRVALQRADSTVSESRVTIDWLPARSVRETTAVFEHDPDAYRIVARVEGFGEP